MRRFGRQQRGDPGAEPIQRVRGAGEASAASTRRAGFAFLFIIAALLAIALLPLWVTRRTEAMRRDIQEVILPARALTSEMQVALAREVAGGRGFLLTGDRRLLERALEAKAVEVASLRALAPLARRLGPDASTQLEVVARRIDGWHALSDSLLAGQIPAEAYVAALPRQEARYEAALSAAFELEQVIQRGLSTRLAAIAEANREGWIIGGLLVVVALIAALGAGWLYRHQRRLIVAVEDSRAAAVRRARAEVALREAVSAVVAAGTTTEVVHAIGTRAPVATDADGAFVSQLDPARRELVVVTAAGTPVPPLHARAAYGGSLAERLIEGGRPEIVTAPERYPFLARRCPDCEILAVPLGHEDRPFGALFVIRRPGRPAFTEDEVERALIFADLATLAFRRLELLETSERRRIELRELLESRARFTRGLSHDVKNPLGVADGFLQLLEMGMRGALTPEQRDAIQRARRAIGDAVRLLDEVLELARAGAGQLTLASEPTAVGRIARAAAEEYRAQAEAKQLALRITIPPDIPVIESDAKRVRRIIGNLLSNAVKYTPEGGRIEVRAELREDGAAPGPGRWITVAVTDTGPGISPEDQRQLFREFARFAGASTVRGTGLGLAVSQSIARALGGVITVESEIGRGSSFTLWLPLEAPAGATALAEAA